MILNPDTEERIDSLRKFIFPSLTVEGIITASVFVFFLAGSNPVAPMRVIGAKIFGTLQFWSWMTADWKQRLAI